MENKVIITTIRLPEKLYKFLFNEIKWKERKAVNKIIIEAINLWLTKNNYSNKVK